MAVAHTTHKTAARQDSGYKKVDKNVTKFNRWCLTARQRNQKQLRCFRCLETNHIANSEIRVKSEKKIKRDLDRLNQFIMRKTCENFPFATLDNLDFTKTIKTSRQGQSNKILRQVNAVTTCQWKEALGRCNRCHQGKIERRKTCNDEKYRRADIREQGF